MAVGETLHAVESASMASRVLTADHSRAAGHHRAGRGPRARRATSPSHARRPARAGRHPAAPSARRHDAGPGPAHRRPRGRARRRPHGPRRGLPAQPRPDAAAGRRRGPARRLVRVRSSRSSRPRAGSARPPSPRTWAPTSPRPAATPCSSTSTWPSVTSRSASSCSRADGDRRVAMSGHLDDQGLASVVDQAPRQRAGRHLRPDRARRGGPHPRPDRRRAARGGRGHYDFVIVDTPPAFTEHVLAAFDISRPARPARHSRHPRAEEPAGGAGHARHARQSEGVAASSCSTARTPRSGCARRTSSPRSSSDIAVNVPSASTCRRRSTAASPIVLDEPKHPVSVAMRQLVDRYIRPAAEHEPAARRRAPASVSLIRGNRR